MIVSQTETDRQTYRQTDRLTDRQRQRETEIERDRERDRETETESLFEWPVAFTKVKLMVANCALAVFRGACKSYEIAITRISRTVTVCR